VWGVSHPCERGMIGGAFGRMEGKDAYRRSEMKDERRDRIMRKDERDDGTDGRDRRDEGRDVQKDVLSGM